MGPKKNSDAPYRDKPLPDGVDEVRRGALPPWVTSHPVARASFSSPSAAPSQSAALCRGIKSGAILPERLLTVPETAAFFRVSEKTIRRLIKAGDITVVRLGRSVRMNPEVIEKIVRQVE